MAVTYADESTFNQLIAEGTVLVDFYADWCGPCMRIAPILDQLSEELTDVKIVKVNVDHNRPIAMNYNVMSIPTLILFKDGQIVAETLGFQPKEQLKAWINANK